MANANKKNIVAIVIMTVLSVLLVPLLAINITLIIKGSTNPDVPPSVFGIAPLAVTSGSMSGNNPDSFDKNALIFVSVLDEQSKQQLAVGDVVTFRSSDVFVTHRIVSVNTDASGKILSVVTKGDANNTTDGAIPLENVLGKCVASVGGLGGFAMFLQTPLGIFIFVGIPVIAVIVYDIVSNVAKKKPSAEKSTEEQLKEKEEEIRRLRAMVNESRQQNASSDQAQQTSSSAQTQQEIAQENPSDGNSFQNQQRKNR